jgi:hypothetical protein
MLSAGVNVPGVTMPASRAEFHLLGARALARGLGRLAFRGRGDRGFGQTRAAEGRKNEREGDKASENAPSQDGEVHEILPKRAIAFWLDATRIVNKGTPSKWDGFMTARWKLRARWRELPLRFP